ncbi:MAG: hypothetical protein RL441_467 [Actinomycetota bacterium]|jgi:predicted DNA-binding transcriptional regulator YafY
MAKDGVRDKTAERQVNLVMLLQSSRVGFTKEQICQRVAGYKDPESEAFNRMFERDKVELLAAGIEIEVLQPDPWDQNVYNYRVSRASALLPDISLSPAEVRALNLATLAWQGSVHAAAATDLKHKLATVGVPTPADAPVARVDLTVDIEPLVSAINTRRRVTFDYRKPRQAAGERREIEPWGLALSHGNWYLYGMDRDRKAVRVFNLARVTSEIKSVGAADSFEIPADADAEKILSRESIQESQVQVRLKVAAGNGQFWRERAVSNELALSDAGEITVVLDLPAFQIPRLAADAPGVVAIAPAEVRQQVIELLEGARHG